MIPNFDENGNLPPGQHLATLEEIEQYFAYNSSRKILFSGLSLLVEELTKAGCTRLYLDGSFITDKEIPNDYDACWETDKVQPTIDPILLNPFKQLTEIKNKYKGDIFPRIPELQVGIDHLRIFQLDINVNIKGIIVIELG
ncbi:MAG: hypothetical protein K2Y22_13940 [Candidatus Obscuribacterales bacterium]|nr:hypothetical protein [Candidatus Obscuribacterales bacterium]